MPDPSTSHFDPLLDVSNRHIVVAGAGSGLGLEIARLLYARGARLLLLDVAGGGLESIGAEMPTARSAAADITDEAAIEKVLDAFLAVHGRIDGLVNAAGILTLGDAETLDANRFRQCIDVNLTGAFLLSRCTARRMPGGGRIVHIASVSSRVANLEYAAYSSSKAALSQLVRVLAREWAAKNVLVNAIGPAVTETAMTASHLAEPAFREQALSVIPMGRFGTPEDLFATVLMLLAAGGSFITGQTLFIDGGRTLV